MSKNILRRVGRSLAAPALLLISASATLAGSLPTEQAAIVQRGYGGPEVLSIATVPVSPPGPGQVLVKIYAASVNPVDWKMREGHWGGRKPGEPPPAMLVPGSDAAGIVIAVGEGVTDLKVGEPVAGSVGGRGFAGPNGAYAHYALAAADHLIHKPKRLTFEQAAGLGTAGDTAALAIYRLQIKPGQILLITGIAGGVGSAMAQLAKAQGAHVIGTASARHTAYLKSIGVDEVIDYTEGDWASKASNVDFVFDTIGGTTSGQALGTLKQGGQFMGINGENGEPSDEQCTAVRVTCVHLRPGRPGDPSDRDLLNSMGQLAEAGKFQVHVDKTFPLAQAADAQQLSREGHTEGKIILVVDSGKAGNR